MFRELLAVFHCCDGQEHLVTRYVGRRLGEICVYSYTPISATLQTRAKGIPSTLMFRKSEWVDAPPAVGIVLVLREFSRTKDDDDDEDDSSQWAGAPSQRFISAIKREGVTPGAYIPACAHMGFRLTTRPVSMALSIAKHTIEDLSASSKPVAGSLPRSIQPATSRARTSSPPPWPP